MPGPGGSWLERGQLPQALARERHVDCEGVAREAGAAPDPELPAVRVEAVARERDPVRTPPECDRPRRVAGQVDDLEPRDFVALLEMPGELHGPTVPPAHQRADQRPRDGRQRAVDPDVVHPAVAGSVGCLGRMAVARSPEERHASSVVGVRVPDHHPLDTAHRVARADERVGHLTDAAVVERDGVVVLDRVDVHRPVRESASQEPDPGRDLCGRRGHEPRRQRDALSRIPGSRLHLHASYDGLRRRHNGRYTPQTWILDMNYSTISVSKRPSTESDKMVSDLWREAESSHDAVRWNGRVSTAARLALDAACEAALESTPPGKTRFKERGSRG